MFKSILLMLFCAAILLTGCAVPITGSGDVVSQDMDIRGFNKVNVGGAFEADIEQDNEFSVVVSVDDNLIEHVEVVKQGHTLIIGFKPNSPFSVRDATLRVSVTMPELTELDLSGASRANIGGFESDNELTIDISGASSLLGDIHTEDARFDVSGSSDMILTGSAEDVKIDLAGSSNANLADFSVEDATIDASGASAVTLNVSDSLKIDASGASTVNYIGSPEIKRVNTSGASSVHRLQ